MGGKLYVLYCMYVCFIVFFGTFVILVEVGLRLEIGDWRLEI